MKSLLAQRIAQANGRLKASNTKIYIEQRGGKLALRATLPPKPGRAKQEHYQQRIPLDISATIDGVTEAEKEARRLRAKLDMGEFLWLEP
ncbi:hypothetical protein NG798_23915 [Ancylothrix sp. C2]|uniref:hypothetical protein n=1 Tax=Ancylothrix sp. D3o TaxID=2953691 RepID=UPI0021BA951E|nr:hypothetical protein [Ancylothrix sp. D3o]MCT7952851.1 hypothetical protein [Ancylothrix sp. D3o]